MTRELLLMRHAKSDWPPDVADFNRPLTKRGRADSQKMADWLQARQLLPELVIASTAARAAETCQLLCARLELPPTRLRWEPRIYEATPTTLLTRLHTTPSSCRRLLLIGHNPGLEQLLLTLAQDQIAMRADGKLMTTAAIARIQLDCDWSEVRAKCGRLITLVRPKEIEQHS
jgi:phosphohistidine phosphatase